MAGSVSKKFVFNNNTDGLYPLVLVVIEHIRQNMPIDEDAESKLRMILVELLTNSLKHSGQEDAILEIETTGHQVNIKKRDTGNGLALRCGESLLEWPLPGRHHANKIITIYEDSSAILKAKLQNNCCLKFFIEEVEETNPVDIGSLAEHFGLMIITRACDTFEYEFDIVSCTNNFTIIYIIQN